LEMILIRGLPGSGKSTLARNICKGYGWLHFEADQFFNGINGYQFDASRLQQAHAWCQEKVRDALSAGLNVVVANTFTQQWELQPYIDIAKERGFLPQIVMCQNNFGNIHAVPDAAIAKMRARWQQTISI
jgi:predicted kinase